MDYWSVFSFEPNMSASISFQVEISLRKVTELPKGVAGRTSLGNNRTYFYLGVSKWSPGFRWDLSLFQPITGQYF